MKIRSARALVLGVLALTVTAAAADPPKPKRAYETIGSFKLSPDAVSNAGLFSSLLPEQGPYDEANKAFADLKAAADALKAARSAHTDALESCKTKSYTTQEIHDACLESDTVAQCSVKLYQRCVGNASRGVDRAVLAVQAADRRLDQAVDAIEKSLKTRR